MPTKISALARRPLWIITSYRNNRMEVLTIDPEGNGGSLPVFSFEEEAKTFLGLSENDQNERRWRSRETTAGELVSVLMAACVGVRQGVRGPPRAGGAAGGGAGLGSGGSLCGSTAGDARPAAVVAGHGQADVPLVQRSPRALCRGAVGEPQGDSRRASTCLGADCLYSPTFREDLLSETRPPVCGVLGTLAYRTE